MSLAVKSSTAAPGVAIREPRGRRPEYARLVVYAILTLGLILLVGPFLWMLAGSFKTPAELHQFPPTLLPAAPTLDNYQVLFSKLNFPLYFFNSTVVAVFVVSANLVFCSMLGYALAKLQFPGKGKIFLIVMATLMVPGTVTLVPLFVLMSAAGLVNSYPALILPFAAGPFGVFLMRQFMLGLPDEILEAARIDGANEFRIFWQIVMPLCRAPLATLGILTFLASWNNFIWPLIVTSNQDKYTLPVAVATFAVGQHQTDYGVLMAGSVVLVLPVLLVFLALQRYFTQGIAMTGLKG